jgi:hypothetical protein
MNQSGGSKNLRIFSGIKEHGGRADTAITAPQGCAIVLGPLRGIPELATTCTAYWR